jgi:hypothetical protein
MSATDDPKTDGPKKTLAVAPKKREDAVKDLESFRVMLGITTPTTEPGFNEETRPYPNEGIYSEISNAEKSRHGEYVFCTWLINGCILAQIIFAATLTALGASASPHDIITVFGAINTAVAGILALMKGQGLPDRYRSDWSGLKDLRLYIDERERSIREGWIETGVKEEVDEIIKRYKSVQGMIEKNRPNMYIMPGSRATTWDAEKGMGNSAGMGGAQEIVKGNDLKNTSD